MISRVKVRVDRKELEEKYHGKVLKSLAPRVSSEGVDSVWIICKPEKNADQQEFGNCDGPFFRVHDRSLEDLGLPLGGRGYSVCPHQVEID